MLKPKGSASLVLGEYFEADEGKEWERGVGGGTKRRGRVFKPKGAVSLVLSKCSEREEGEEGEQGGGGGTKRRGRPPKPKGAVSLVLGECLRGRKGRRPKQVGGILVGGEGEDARKGITAVSIVLGERLQGASEVGVVGIGLDCLLATSLLCCWHRSDKPLLQPDLLALRQVFTIPASSSWGRTMPDVSYMCI